MVESWRINGWSPSRRIVATPPGAGHEERVAAIHLCRLQHRFRGCQRLQFSFHSRDLGLSLVTGPQNVPILNWDRTTIGILPFRKFMRHAHEIPTGHLAVRSVDLVDQRFFRAGEALIDEIYA